MMSWGALLSAAVVACPPGAPIVYHSNPNMCCFVGMPAPVAAYEVPCVVQSSPAPSMALFPVPMEPLTTTQAVAQDKEVEAVTEPASAEELDQSVLEDAAFGFPGGGFSPRPTLDHLGLGWGVASIGNGVLSPTQGVSGGSSGFGGLGGGNNGGTPSGSNGTSTGTSTGTSSNFTNIITMPPIFINLVPTGPGPILPPPIFPPGRTTDPVPEPATWAIWGLLAAGAVWRRRLLASS